MFPFQYGRSADYERGPCCGVVGSCHWNLITSRLIESDAGKSERNDAPAPRTVSCASGCEYGDPLRRIVHVRLLGLYEREGGQVQDTVANFRIASVTVFVSAETDSEGARATEREGLYSNTLYYRKL